MAKKLSKISRQEILEVLKLKYSSTSKQGKSRILDELSSLFKCHRKHGVRLLANTGKKELASKTIRQRIYDDGVKEALIVVWEAADRICKNWGRC